MAGAALLAANDGAQQPEQCALESASGGACSHLKSHGRLRLDLRERGGETYLAREHQSGCMRSRVLRKAPDGTLTIAVINTAGGLTGGDSVKQSLHWHAGSAACITTPTAEKIYRAKESSTKVDITLDIAKNADAEFLPQETIFFDGGQLDRTLNINLHASSSLLLCDAVVFGRHAHGEEVRQGSFRDTLTISRQDELILFDRTHVTDFPNWFAGASTLAGNRASGIVVLAAPDCERRLAAIQSATEHTLGIAGASLVRSLIFVRLLARGDAELRHDLTLMLKAARSELTLPRNWSC